MFNSVSVRRRTFSMTVTAIALAFPLSGLAGPLAQNQATPDSAQVPRDFLKSAAHHGAGLRADGIKTSSLKKSGVPGIDSLVNFVDQFVADGFDTAGNPQSVWPYSMVGPQRPPVGTKSPAGSSRSTTCVGRPE